MNTARGQVGWRFWFWWVLASTVGFAVGLAVPEPVIEAMEEAVVGAVVGASAGIAQWLVLQWRVSRAGWWVLASIVGLAVGFAVPEAVAVAVEEVGLAVGLSGYGAITGGVLVWLLRRSVTSEPSPPIAAA